jgi:hypothetical protein
MQRNFFATGSDFLPVLEQVERKHPVTYLAAGLFASAELARVELGVLLTGINGGSDVGYLVTPEMVEVHVRPVPQCKGGILYAVDAVANPASITLRPGCMVGANVLLAGTVGTDSTNGQSAALHRAFVGAIGKHFKRVQSYWVGPAALALLSQGARLTPSVKAPREYDLRLEAGCDV